ncbi:cupin domain-containing protein [Actinomycetaceae bacterium MB13-C1-2]|nr:cupin domain-containing protein [Actinomycetaceae bacterium MB13-C1-2]
MEVTAVGFDDVPGATGVSMSMLLDQTRLERVRVDIAVLDEHSSLPRHRAGQNQLFYVVSGTGRVAGADDVEVPVGPGTLVEWQAGEEHTSWAYTRMTVLIIQERSAPTVGGSQ